MGNGISRAPASKMATGLEGQLVAFGAAAAAYFAGDDPKLAALITAGIGMLPMLVSYVRDLIAGSRGVGPVSILFLMCALTLTLGCSGFVGTTKTTPVPAPPPVEGSVATPEPQVASECKGVGWTFGQSSVGGACTEGGALSSFAGSVLGVVLKPLIGGLTAAAGAP